MSLIEQRHPKLGQLLRVWQSHCHGDGLPSARALVGDALSDLAPSTVLLRPTNNACDRLTIATSGAEVDALYGESLAGASVERLAPLRGDAAMEAKSAIETARPVVIEDELRVGNGRRRVARLYLPLANDDGSADGVLCGIVAVS